MSGRNLSRSSSVAVTSTRKFDRFGDWHYPRLVGRYLLSLVIPGDRMERAARRYWYECRDVERGEQE